MKEDGKALMVVDFHDYQSGKNNLDLKNKFEDYLLNGISKFIRNNLYIILVKDERFGNLNNDLIGLISDYDKKIILKKSENGLLYDEKNLNENLKLLDSFRNYNIEVSGLFAEDCIKTSVQSLNFKGFKNIKVRLDLVLDTFYENCFIKNNRIERTICEYKDYLVDYSLGDLDLNKNKYLFDLYYGHK